MGKGKTENPHHSTWHPHQSANDTCMPFCNENGHPHHLCSGNLKRITKGRRNERDPNSPELEVLSADWTEYREKFSRRTAWELHQGIYKIKGGYQDVKSEFFQGYSPVKEEASAPTSKKPNFRRGRRRVCTLSAVELLHK